MTGLLRLQLRLALAALALGCSAARPPLPAPPPAKALQALSSWISPPPLAPEPRLHVEWSTERVRLDSGLGLNVISRPDSDLTSLVLWVPSAAAVSEGPVAVMVEALRAGTQGRDGITRVDPRLALQAIALRTDANGSLFSWRLLPSATPLGLELLSDFVTRPSFEPAQTRVVLQQELATIQRNSGSPAHVADIARNALPGIHIPTPERDASGLVSLTPALLRDVHRCTLSLRGAELVVVGPAAANALTGWARAAFEGAGRPIAGGRGSAASDDAGCQRWGVPRAAHAAAPRDRLDLQIIYGGSFDPWVFLAVPGPALSSDDYLPFVLLSRLLENRDSDALGLRHRGATYGIHARIEDGYPGGVLLELEGQVAPDDAQAALRRLVEDIQALSTTLEERELEEVKHRWRTSFIYSLSNDAALASAALWQLRRGRPLESVKSWPDELSQISLERCRAVATKWLNAAQPSIAVAGLPVKLVRGLGLAANVREYYWTDELQEPKKAL